MEENFITIEKLISLAHHMNQNSKKSRDFNIGFELYQSEIHTIESIYNHENINASTLAKILGVTNGALNQMTTKLIKKGLVVQYHKENNKKDVYYRLTDLGIKANNAHKQYHAKLYNEILTYLNSLDSKQLSTINNFLDNLIEIMF